MSDSDEASGSGVAAASAVDVVGKGEEVGRASESAVGCSGVVTVVSGMGAAGAIGAAADCARGPLELALVALGGEALGTVGGLVAYVRRRVGRGR